MSKFVTFDSAAANPEFPQIFDVTPEEVNDKKESVVLIDVRRPNEYVGEFGHIPGADLLTLDFLPQKIDSLPKEKTIIFICRSGNRSAHATAYALENGFTSVYNMKGGMIAWTEKNFAAEDKEEE